MVRSHSNFGYSHNTIDHLTKATYGGGVESKSCSYIPLRCIDSKISITGHLPAPLLIFFIG